MAERNYSMIEHTDLEEVLLVTPQMIHEDFRGTNVEIFNKALYANGVIDKVGWKIDSVSRSRQHVLRGVHGDENTYKLISCLYGTIYLLVVDNRPWSHNTKSGYLSLCQIKIVNKF